MNIEIEIREIKNALHRIERKLDDAGKGRGRHKNTQKQKALEEDFSGATGGVRLLISKSFFKQRRQLAEVIQQLHADGYLYSKQAFQIAVTRLAKVGGPLTSVKHGKIKLYAERK